VMNAKAVEGLEVTYCAQVFGRGSEREIDCFRSNPSRARIRDPPRQTWREARPVPLRFRASRHRYARVEAGDANCCDAARSRARQLADLRGPWRQCRRKCAHKETTTSSSASTIRRAELAVREQARAIRGPRAPEIPSARVWTVEARRRRQLLAARVKAAASAGGRTPHTASTR